MAGKRSTDEGGNALAGRLIAAYAVLGIYVTGLPVVLSAVWLRPLVVFAVAAAAVILLNIAVCRWVDDNWDGWFAGSSRQKVEQRFDKLREGRLMQHPLAWIEDGSDAWLALGAAVVNAVTAVVTVRLIDGKKVGAHRILVASVGYGVFFAALFTLLGFLLGGAVRAL